MLQTRLITAIIALPAAAALIFAGGLWFFTATLIIALIAGWEFSHMMQLGGYKTTPLFTLGLILLLMLNEYRSDFSLECILGLALLSSLTWQLFQGNSETPTADWALTLAGGLYIGWGMAHLVALRQLGDGLAWIWLTLLSTWAADSFAYFAGRTLGRHKLWSRHSPKKTWEGLMGGVVGGIVGAAIAAIFFSSLDWTTALIIGVIVPVVGLFGDLSISMMKRNIGVKDTSNLFPGHGGFLDRADSVLFVSVVVYYIAVWGGLFQDLKFGFWFSGLGF